MVHYDTEYLRILARDPEQHLTIRELAQLVIDLRFELDALKNPDHGHWSTTALALKAAQKDLKAANLQNECLQNAVQRIYKRLNDAVSAGTDLGPELNAICLSALTPTEKRFCECGHAKHAGICPGVVQAERDEPCLCNKRVCAKCGNIGYRQPHDEATCDGGNG